MKSLICFFSYMVFILTLQPVVCSGSHNTSPIYSLTETWLDERGEEVSFAQWKGKRIFISMFYVDCTLICPRTVAKLKKIEKRLIKESDDAEFILVTLETQFDKPRRLARYKKGRHLGDNWHLLVGNKTQTDGLARWLDYYTLKMDDHYFHEFRIYDISPQGKIQNTIEWNDELDKLF